MGRLFWKFFFFILVAQITAAVAVGIIFSLERRERIHNTTELDLSPSAALFVRASAESIKVAGTDALSEIIRGGSRRRIYAVDDSSHDILGRDVPPRLIQKAKTALQDETTQRSVDQITAPDGQRYLVFLSAPRKDEQLLAFGEPGNSGFFFPVIPVLTGTIASLFFAMLLAWYFSQPIRKLKLAFASAASGNLNARLAVQMGKRNDELADLGRDFDLMTEQLQTLVESQRRLLHDVSHELRSPIARMQAAIGLVRVQPDKLPATIERIEREGVRMDKLVGDLLYLSRLEAGFTGTMDEHIRMEDLLQEIINDAQFEAQNCARYLESDIHNDAMIQGRAELLHSAIENVVRNAIKQTPSETTVTIIARVESDHQRLLITVSDRGPGVPEHELLAIFDPFFRSSRTQQTSNGYGLGLTIARRIIEAHGGTITASNRADQGLCVSIALPCSTSGNISSLSAA
ncbi:two-component system OmpR family sensor kinase [Herbaspirillum sp. Sphag1AN]|uniref:HAMP domain-containing sensor histidine kinase n=1 Tax=unclassified Herbaspirillum TaxID=2624150 RepID=UPI00161694E0|nr:MULTISPECIES: ATP-binding protein [unclassified Herbaspirillum]MBB3211956.1 two-component system OmpR family sensor kinase [Herbaspirillum sp. Sphag1AN]MBB3244210.1 two-component system OmpR family sensor kinase [Herbaspirillum sp. Sphag64]